MAWTYWISSAKVWAETMKIEVEMDNKFFKWTVKNSLVLKRSFVAKC